MSLQDTCLNAGYDLRYRSLPLIALRHYNGRGIILIEING
jgi:hypothetical protein